MVESGTPLDRRAQNTALLGLILQVVAVCVLAGIAYYADSDVFQAAARFVGAGVFIWFALFLALVQMRRVEAEGLETAELKRAQAEGKATALFELDDESLLLEQNRLKWLVKYMLPTMTVLSTLALLVGYFFFWDWSLSTAFGEGVVARTKDAMIFFWVAAGLGVVCFMLARYTLGFSRIQEWRILHAGATIMSGNALICLVLAISMMASGTIDWAEPLAAYLVRVVMLVLGIEFAANFILDFYRPRGAELIPRPSFDSRLLGLLTEPGGIARSLAEAVNYQFGFEVSKTWFYALIQQWFFPLIVASCVVVILLTSVVVVDADEQVVIERFGRRVTEPRAVLDPGVYLKYPWPIDVVYRAPVRRVQEIVIGEPVEAEAVEGHAEEALLWTDKHEFVSELMLLVASRDLVELSRQSSDDQAASGRGAPVGLLMVSMPMQYRIRSIEDYLYNYEEPTRLLEEIAHEFLSEYAASVDIDQLMGPGRSAFNATLRERIQKRADELKLGVDVAFVGIQDAHPPSNSQVAAKFQEVIAAQTRMGADINAARGEARKTLTKVAGTQERALELDAAIRVRDTLVSQSGADPAALAEAEQHIEDLLLGNPEKGILPASGDAAALIAEARTEASQLVSDAQSKSYLFKSDVAAYTAAPSLYMARKRLELYQGIDTVRKYLIVGDSSNVIVEYQTEQPGGLDTILKESAEGSTNP